MYPSFFQFLLELNLSLSLGFGLYWLLLRKQNTFQWNRIFLLLWPIFAILIAGLTLKYTSPALIYPTPKSQIFHIMTDHSTTAGMEMALNTTSSKAPKNHWLPSILGLIYFAGVLMSFYLLTLRLIKVRHLILIGSAQRSRDYILLSHDKYQQVFSFGRYIFKPKDQDLPDMVLAHELIHVRQRHSTDLIWMELLIVLNWFNPIIYLYRKHLIETQEFIADRSVSQQYGTLAYVRLLVAEATQQTVPALALSFAAFTKKRIIAMKTKTRQPWSKLWYLLSLPLLLGLFGFISLEQVEDTLKGQTPNDLVIPWSQGGNRASLTFAEEQWRLEQTNEFALPIAQENIKRISSYFGPRIHPVKKVKNHHRGIDFVAPTGTPVLAAEQGNVILIEDKPTGYGKRIVIQHSNNLRTLYAHLNSMQVAVGDILEKEQVIGTVGSSGTSFGPHLHFEIRKEGKPRNPVNYLPKLEK